MKKVIVLPGSDSQVPLVKKLREQGVKVIVFNPYKNSPAFSYADEHVMVDILDKEACLSYARKIRPDAVLSDMCDIAMPTVAYISEALNLRSLGTHCAALFTDKWEMRKFCKEHNLPSPDCKMCYTIGDAKCFFNELNVKCIIKPLDSNSSRGVFIIETIEDIDIHFEETMSFSKCKKAVLIEQYIDGTEFTVDGLMTPNGHVCLAISEKEHYLYNKNIAYKLYFSYSNSRFNYDLLRETNDSYVNLSNLPVGCFTHAEYKFEKGMFYLIEIGARGGGNFISSDIVPIMTGIDNYQYLIDTMLFGRNKCVTVSESLRERCAVLYFFDVDKVGIVKSISNEELLKENPQILRYKFNFKIGEYIQKAENDSKRLGYYIAYEESGEKLDKLMESINSNVKIVVNN